MRAKLGSTLHTSIYLRNHQEHLLNIQNVAFELMSEDVEQQVLVHVDLIDLVQHMVVDQQLTIMSPCLV